jgi:trigger factor
VRERLERELSGAIKSHIKQQVMNGLAELHEFQLPESLIAAEIEGLRSNFQRQLAMGGSGEIDPQQFPDDMFRQEAQRRVKLGLVIQAVVAQHEVTPDPDRVRNMVEELASSYEQPEQVVNWYYNNEEQLSQIRSMALEEQVVAMISAEAVMTDVEQSYEEVMHRGHDHQNEDGDSESPDSGE